MIFAHGREIVKNDVSTKTTEVIQKKIMKLCISIVKFLHSVKQHLANTTSIGGLDYHFEHGIVFWSDLEENKIFSAPLTLQDTRSASRLIITLPDNTRAVAIAVDWITEKIYIADAFGHKVDVVDFDGSHYTTVISSNQMWEPTDLAIDPTVGLLFVAEKERIFRTSMDGLTMRTILTNSAHKVSGVAVDLATKRLFWSDKDDHSIETVDYDGRNRHLIIRGAPNNPATFHLTLFERTVFWTDGGIRSVGKFNGKLKLQ